MENAPERFDPTTMGGLIAAEHLARYRAVAAHCAGKEVLDAGCGLGYGTVMLAANAARATGLDLDPEAIAEARNRAGSGTSAEFTQGSILELPFEDDSFDLATCFEAIEHLPDHERALDELHRVLRPGGLLAVSSPNPVHYPEGNPHHVRELDSAELAEALGRRFGNVEIYLQRVWIASTLMRAGEFAERGQSGTLAVDRTAEADRNPESFALAVASDAELPPLDPSVSLASPTTPLQLLDRRKLVRKARHGQNVTNSRTWRYSEPLRRIGQRIRGTTGRESG